MRRYLVVLAAATALAGAAHAQSRSPVAERVLRLTRESSWKLVASVTMPFTTHHPQGLVKIGEQFFISAVEIRVPTKRYATAIDGYDRDAGEGVGDRKSVV